MIIDATRRLAKLGRHLISMEAKCLPYKGTSLCRLKGSAAGIVTLKLGSTKMNGADQFQTS